MPNIALSAQEVVDQVYHHIGQTFDPDQITVFPCKTEHGKWRTIAILPNNTMAFIVPEQCVTEDPTVLDRMRNESNLLDTLQGQQIELDVYTPKNLYRSPDDRVVIRDMESGLAFPRYSDDVKTPWNPVDIYADNDAAMHNFADMFGRLIGRIHQIKDIPNADYDNPAGRKMPNSVELFETFDGLLNDEEISIIQRYSAMVECDDTVEKVLLHNDYCPQNLTGDLETGKITGVFDFESAEMGHPITDLYPFHRYGREFYHRVMDAYEDETGHRIDRRLPAIVDFVAGLAFIANNESPENLNSPDSDERRSVEFLRTAVRNADRDHKEGYKPVPKLHSPHKTDMRRGL